MSLRGRPERWGISSLKVGECVTTEREKDLAYLKIRFRKYGYKYKVTIYPTFEDKAQGYTFAVERTA